MQYTKSLLCPSAFPSLHGVLESGAWQPVFSAPRPFGDPEVRREKLVRLSRRVEATALCFSPSIRGGHPQVEVTVLHERHHAMPGPHPWHSVTWFHRQRVSWPVRRSGNPRCKNRNRRILIFFPALARAPRRRAAPRRHSEGRAPCSASLSLAVLGDGL